MKKSGRSTLAIDKAIQNFFNSKCKCENPPPLFAFLQDASPQESYKSASIAVTRLRNEHGIISEVVTKPAGIFIYESEEEEDCDGDQCAIESLDAILEGHATDPGEELDKIKVAPLSQEDTKDAPEEVESQDKPAGSLVDLEDIRTKGKDLAKSKKKS